MKLPLSPYFPAILVSLPLLTTCPVSSQELKHRENVSVAAPAPEFLPAIVSHQKLSPALYGSSLLRFSPDGRFLLIQDDSGFFVLTAMPLALVFHVEIFDAYPARFSSDSKTVTVLGADYALGAWQASDGKLIERREASLSGGCLDAQLSPYAVWLACLTPDFTLNLFRTSDFKVVASVNVEPTRPSMSLSIIPLGRDSAFSGPIGTVLSTDLAPLANQRLFSLPYLFSPDERTMLVQSPQRVLYRLDLPSLAKSNVPGALRDVETGILAMLSAERAIARPKKNDSSSSIVSLQTGDTVGPANFNADKVAIATNSRYAEISSESEAKFSLFDLAENKSVESPSAIAGDVHGNNLALLSEDGEVQIYNLGSQRPALRGRLPLGSLPRLQTAATDDAIKTLALAIRGGAAIFDIETGKRILGPTRFVAAEMASFKEAALLQRRARKTPDAVLPWNSASASLALPLWTASRDVELWPSRSVLIEYSLDRQRGTYIQRKYDGNEGVPFVLRGLEFRTGKELWKHRFPSAPPIPYSDPQGDHFVLAWKATSADAYHVAKQFPAAANQLKKQKLKDQDTFFEVLDARTGSPTAGSLVQFGSGAGSFDMVFSCGDRLFLIKDQLRLSLVDLGTGKILGRYRGAFPAASEKANLFTLIESDGIGLYDLKTASKLARLPFTDAIALTRFSESGDRLLILTKHQHALILDVGKSLSIFAVRPDAPEAQPSQ